jgi:hypothetical protein
MRVFKLGKLYLILEKMKKIIFILELIILSTYSFSQYNSPDDQVINQKETRRLAREHKLAEKHAQEEKARELTADLVKAHRFILEADYVAGRLGSRYPVNSTLNFIMIDSTDAVLQLGSPYGIGYNGVGGITIDGTVTKYELAEQQHKKSVSYTITVYIMSSLGAYDVQFWVTPLGNTDAIVRGNFSGSVTYSGRIVPLGKSRVYKGMSSI